MRAFSVLVLCCIATLVMSSSINEYGTPKPETSSRGVPNVVGWGERFGHDTMFEIASDQKSKIGVAIMNGRAVFSQIYRTDQKDIDGGYIYCGHFVGVDLYEYMCEGFLVLHHDYYLPALVPADKFAGMEGFDYAEPVGLAKAESLKCNGAYTNGAQATTKDPQMQSTVVQLGDSRLVAAYGANTDTEAVRIGTHFVNEGVIAYQDDPTLLINGIGNKGKNNKAHKIENLRASKIKIVKVIGEKDEFAPMAFMCMTKMV